MGCGCGSKKAGGKQTYVVVLPSGRQKAYSVQSNAEAEVAKHPGAYIKPTPAVSA